MPGRLSHAVRYLVWGSRILLLLLIVDGFYLGLNWPDWDKLASGPVPKSNFIKAYLQERKVKQDWPPLRWSYVDYAAMPEYLPRAAIVGEDSRFYYHKGFDFLAFKDAMEHNLNRQAFAFGASTISQQTVKNLFLSSSRNPLRKWHELILTWGMEYHLSKKRILELYLNIAEFGRGIYGVQAASQHYWGRSVSRLSRLQAAELAATLPSPVKHNPFTHTSAFKRRTQKILYWLHRQDIEMAKRTRGHASNP